MRGPFSGVILVVSLTTTLFLLARNRHRRLTVHREITHFNLAHRDSSDSLNFGLDDRIIASGRDVYKQSGSYYNQVKVVDRSELLKHRRLSERQLIHQQYLDPRTVAQRNHPLLSSQVFKINPLIKPDGYPWQRWSPASDGSYPLNVKKFVAILAKLGRGQNELGTLHPKDYVSNNSLLTPNTIRFYGPVQTFIIRNGEVLRPKGGTGAFVSLVQHAVNKAKEYVNVEPGLKLLTEGDFPLIYDPNDYPWCGDDYVPVFRLNAIRSTQCMHSWPVLSLTYFNEASNIQLLDSPYQWEKLMNEWDQSYPWNSKIPKVVWRGRLTGYTYEDREKPRIRLIEYANPYSDIMDIQVSTRSNLIDQDDFQKYIAVLDIDGNAWSARFAKLLCYNSVVIKVSHRIAETNSYPLISYNALLYLFRWNLLMLGTGTKKLILGYIIYL